LQVTGIDTLGGCKGVVFFYRYFFLLLLLLFLLKALAARAEPELQFRLVHSHLVGLRQIPELMYSQIVVLVERNLGFEAEHMERAFRGTEGVMFYHDEAAKRVGILTTENVKLGAMTMTNVMLREKRVHLLGDEHFVSSDGVASKRRLREQLEIYSFQFKLPESVFQKARYALCGKVGGLKDDIVICLQLGIYWSETLSAVFQ
jgi:hypothetical protein